MKSLIILVLIFWSNVALSQRCYVQLVDAPQSKLIFGAKYTIKELNKVFGEPLEMCESVDDGYDALKQVVNYNDIHIEVVDGEFYSFSIDNKRVLFYDSRIGEIIVGNSINNLLKIDKSDAIITRSDNHIYIHFALNNEGKIEYSDDSLIVNFDSNCKIVSFYWFSPV